MDLFNTKKIKKLEDTIKSVRLENLNYADEMISIDKKIKRLEKFIVLLVQVNTQAAPQSFENLKFGRGASITDHEIQEALYNEEG